MLRHIGIYFDATWTMVALEQAPGALGHAPWNSKLDSVIQDASGKLRGVASLINDCDFRWSDSRLGEYVYFFPVGNKTAPVGGDALPGDIDHPPFGAWPSMQRGMTSHVNLHTCAVSCLRILLQKLEEENIVLAFPVQSVTLALGRGITPKMMHVLATAVISVFGIEPRFLWDMTAISGLHLISPSASGAVRQFWSSISDRTLTTRAEFSTEGHLNLETEQVAQTERGRFDRVTSLTSKREPIDAALGAALWGRDAYVRQACLVDVTKVIPVIFSGSKCNGDYETVPLICLGELGSFSGRGAAWFARCIHIDVSTHETAILEVGAQLPWGERVTVGTMSAGTEKSRTRSVTFRLAGEDLWGCAAVFSQSGRRVGQVMFCWPFQSKMGAYLGMSSPTSDFIETDDVDSLRAPLLPASISNVVPADSSHLLVVLVPADPIQISADVESIRVPVLGGCVRGSKTHAVVVRTPDGTKHNFGRVGLHMIRIHQHLEERQSASEVLEIAPRRYLTLKINVHERQYGLEACLAWDVSVPSIDAGLPFPYHFTNTGSKTLLPAGLSVAAGRRLFWRTNITGEITIANRSNPKRRLMVQPLFTDGLRAAMSSAYLLEPGDVRTIPVQRRFALCQDAVTTRYSGQVQLRINAFSADSGEMTFSHLPPTTMKLPSEVATVKGNVVCLNDPVPQRTEVQSLDPTGNTNVLLPMIGEGVAEVSLLHADGTHLFNGWAHPKSDLTKETGKGILEIRATGAELTRAFPGPLDRVDADVFICGEQVPLVAFPIRLSLRGTIFGLEQLDFSMPAGHPIAVPVTILTYDAPVNSLRVECHLSLRPQVKVRASILLTDPPVGVKRLIRTANRAEQTLIHANRDRAAYAWLLLEPSGLVGVESERWQGTIQLITATGSISDEIPLKWTHIPNEIEVQMVNDMRFRAGVRELVRTITVRNPLPKEPLLITSIRGTIFLTAPGRKAIPFNLVSFTAADNSPLAPGAVTRLQAKFRSVSPIVEILWCKFFSSQFEAVECLGSLQSDTRITLKGATLP